MPILHQSANPSPIDQYWTYLPIFYQSFNLWHIFQSIVNWPASFHPRQIQRQYTAGQASDTSPTKQLDCHQLAVHWHALAHMMLIRCQSEDNCPTNLGTSILYGSTDSLNGGWFRTFHNATARPIQPTPCHNANPWSFHCQSTVNPCLIPLILKGTSSK